MLIQDSSNTVQMTADQPSCNGNNTVLDGRNVMPMRASMMYLVVRVGGGAFVIPTVLL
ncbi:hypothetical protein L195_g056137 [Trifolium pratense]|uniref:Uncharacterized protein n=1 Tax=Trifolium pratense TaxID=57577 RepID=A0A2K3KQ34_TRIPR|nr:hypothetical protein L195_g056137 [Trifolium pratense]